MTVEEEILFAYEQGVQAWTEAGRIPDPSYPGLAEWMVEDGPLLDAAIRVNSELLESELVVIGEVETNAFIHEFGEDRALVRDCQLDMAPVYDAAGEIVQPVRGFHVLFQADMRATPDGWKTYEWQTDLEPCDP